VETTLLSDAFDFDLGFDLDFDLAANPRTGMPHGSRSLRNSLP